MSTTYSFPYNQTLDAITFTSGGSEYTFIISSCANGLGAGLCLPTRPIACPPHCLLRAFTPPPPLDLSIMTSGRNRRLEPVFGHPPTKSLPHWLGRPIQTRQRMGNTPMVRCLLAPSKPQPGKAIPNRAVFTLMIPQREKHLMHGSITLRLELPIHYGLTQISICWSIAG